MEKKENNNFHKEEEELIKYNGLKDMASIFGYEAFEKKLGTLGASSHLRVYLTTVLNMNSVTAEMLIGLWNGSTNFVSILGSLMSDTDALKVALTKLERHDRRKVGKRSRIDGYSASQSSHDELKQE